MVKDLESAYNYSLLNVVIYLVLRKITVQEISDIFELVTLNELKNILFYTKDLIVSIIINNSCYS